MVWGSEKVWSTWCYSGTHDNQRNFHRLAGLGFTYTKPWSLNISKYENWTPHTKQIPEQQSIKDEYVVKDERHKGRKISIK